MSTHTNSTSPGAANDEGPRRGIRGRFDVPLCLVAALAFSWAVVVSLTGGFRVVAGGLRLSSHRISVPFLVGVLALLATGSNRARVRSVLDRLRAERIGQAGAIALSLLALVIGVLFGTFTAAGADAFGYLAQSDLWANGEVFAPQGPALAMRWADSAWAFCPLGFRPSPVHDAMVPVYAPGLSLMMAGAGRLAGDNARFLIVPLAGAITVYLTFVLGRRLFSRTAGLIAAALTAASPVLLFQLVQPMSDVPVTACWLASIVALSDRRRVAALGSGLLASLAILVRPNLAPLAVPLAVFALVANGRGGLWRDFDRAMIFAAGAVPGCALVAWEQAVLYGSPLLSGYGRPSDLYAFAPVLPNLQRYLLWSWQTHTVFLFLALLAPAWAVRRTARAGARSLTWLALSVVACLVGCYLPYYSYEHWTYLRFLLPGLPLMLVLAAGVFMTACSRLGAWRRPAVIFVIAFLALFQLQVAVNGDAFRLGAGFRDRYREVGRFIDEHYEANAIFVSVLQSGSVRYYGRRQSVRFDLLRPGELDVAVSDLARGGFKPYLLLDETEVSGFRARFSQSDRLGRLDWRPHARLGRHGEVVVYNPRDAALR